LIHGIDTSFLVQVEVLEHPGHASARAVLEQLLDESGAFAIAPQVLAEFIHVTTDRRRFERPLDVRAARLRAERWWNAKEVVRVFPTERAVALFHTWLGEFRLGRKRLLDTMLAATYCASDVASIVSTNARDFRVFGCFSIIETDSM